MASFRFAWKRRDAIVLFPNRGRICPRKRTRPPRHRVSSSPGLFGALLNERSLGSIVGSVALVAFWFLRREYYGVWHDARIYMGRGLADLDPQGVGSDLFYRFDGQSSFSVFSKIVDVLIPVFGLAHSALLLSATSLLLWLAAMAALAGQLASGRLKWAILICVATSSGSYGALGLLHYAEAFATPRPFAEAGVLAALAALLAGRKLTAMLFLLLAALFHPIMALVGVGAFYLYICAEDRRWIYLGLVGGFAVALAALLGRRWSRASCSASIGVGLSSCECAAPIFSRRRGIRPTGRPSSFSRSRSPSRRRSRRERLSVCSGPCWPRA